MARGGPSAMTTGATQTPELLAGTIVRYSVTMVTGIVVQENYAAPAFFVDHSLMDL